MLYIITTMWDYDDLNQDRKAEIQDTTNLMINCHEVCQGQSLLTEPVAKYTATVVSFNIFIVVKLHYDTVPFLQSWIETVFS